MSNMSNPSRNIEDKIVFGVSLKGQGDGVPLILLGVPAGAWEYMRAGKTHHFDLTPIGIPFKLMMFGAADHTTALKTIEEANKSRGLATLDMRNRDFSIKPKGDAR